jgi:hypothetical protein
VIPWRSLATEAAVLGVFAAGLLVSKTLRRRWSPMEIVLMYAVGLLFEILTAFMWRYHHILFVLPSRVDDDLSIFFPLGWAGMITGATAVGERLADRWRVRGAWGRHGVLALAWLVIGDLAETTFHRIGMIEYVRSPDTEFNFWLGRVPGLPPTMILLGYGIFQPFASRLFQRLERDLRGGARR